MKQRHSGVAQTSIRSGSDVTEARIAAADLCSDLRRGELLDSAFDNRVAPLDARDRRWTQELVYGMLRQRSWIDAHLAARVRGGLGRLDGDVLDLLRLAAYQLLFMGSVPAYAAIAQMVQLTKDRHGIGAGGLANAVLRRMERERDDLQVAIPDDPIDALSLRYSHPRWIVARWVEQWGAENTEGLLAANNREAPTVLRPFGLVREQLEAMLESAGIHVADAPLVRDSLQLSNGASLAELAAFRQGRFYVQDPGATLVAMYASIPGGATVADLCASPGGKALELARTAGVVLAADRSAARTVRMRANFLRVDCDSPQVMVADARHPAIRAVDAVLVDAPCTGTGTFRRHPDARWRLKMPDIAAMAALQRSIVRAAARVVKPGGLLIYATCSLEPEENDAQIDSFLEESSEWELEAPTLGAVPSETLDGGRLRVLPHRHGVDGAFAARLRRAA